MKAVHHAVLATLVATSSSAVVVAAPRQLLTARDHVAQATAQRSREVLVPAATFRMGMEATAGDVIAERCMNDLPARQFPIVVQLGAGRITEKQAFNDVMCAQYQANLIAMPVHDVTLAAFFIDRFEVTAGDYQQCVDAGGCASEPLVAGADVHLRSDLPMVNILPDEAAGYCQWRGGRLPTEAEWEYAARGNDGRTFAWGNQDRVNRSNLGQGMHSAQRLLDESRDVWNGNEYFFGNDADGFLTAAPPGSFPLGRGPFGTEDQIGNVAEIVADAFVEANPMLFPVGQPTPAPPAPLSPVNPWRQARPGDLHVIRGGAWNSPSWAARADVVDFTYNNVISDKPRRSPVVGFRCARPVVPSLSGAPR
jgi:formylglycine-generating enzyme required for sulfatase activity